MTENEYLPWLEEPIPKQHESESLDGLKLPECFTPIHDMDVVSEMGTAADRTGSYCSGSKKRKLSLGALDVDETEHNADDEKSHIKGSTSISKQRGRQKNLLERRQILEADKWCLKVQEDCVKCKGCRTWVKLQAGRKYDLKDWVKHKEVCPQISGLKIIRTGAKKRQQSKVTHLLQIAMNYYLMLVFS